MSYVRIEPGDQAEFAEDEDGYPAVRIENRVWVQEPQWIAFSGGGYDAQRRVTELIEALELVRAAMGRTDVA